MPLSEGGRAMKAFRSVLLFMAAVCLPGCASLRLQPDRPVAVNREVASLVAFFDASKYDAWEAMPEETVPQRRAKDARRNEIVNKQILAVDLQFDDFAQSFSKGSGQFNVGADTAIAALGGAGSVVTVAQTGKILAALSTLVSGTRTSVDKNLFFEKTAPVLLSKMEALRKQAMVPIREGLN